MLNDTGGLIESIHLDGDDSRIGEEELEQFIASFPIAAWPYAGSR
jgi:hypothetical protein